MVWVGPSLQSEMIDDAVGGRHEIFLQNAIWPGEWGPMHIGIGRTHFNFNILISLNLLKAGGSDRLIDGLNEFESSTRYLTPFRSATRPRLEHDSVQMPNDKRAYSTVRTVSWIHETTLPA